MSRGAVDAGQTGTRAVVVSSDGRRGPIGTSAGVIHLAAPGGAQRTGDLVVAALRGSLGDREPAEPVTLIAAGISGYDPDRAVAARAAVAMQAAFPGATVLLTSDVVTSYLGALGTEPGVVVAVGTGVVALGWDGAGRCAFVNGAGYVLGDEGGGGWVGRRGLVEAVRHVDGRGGSPGLARAAELAFGPLDRLQATVYASGQPAALLASFAPAVAEVARDGDALARRIWAEAVEELVDTAKAAARVLPAGSGVRVAVLGSMFAVRDLLADPFAARVAERLPGAAVVEAGGNGLEGAVLLTRPGIAERFPGLVHVFGPVAAGSPGVRPAGTGS